MKGLMYDFNSNYHIVLEEMHGAPFVTSRILLTEYNSVQQNTNYVGQNYILSNRIRIMLDRIVFCWTELHSVDRITFCPTEYNSVEHNTILSNRIRILSNRITFCRQCNSVQQNSYSVQQNSYSVQQNL